MKTIYVIAGEVSGDLHAANLVSKLVQSATEKIKFVGMGGPKMERAGVSLHFDYKSIAIMGFWEVLTQAKRLKQVIRMVAEDIEQQRPQSIILVDSSGFNLRLAKQIKKTSNIPIHYYIAPKIWAWGEWRIKKIKKYIDFIYCILPFEQEYFRSKGYQKAYYVGNPTLDEIHSHQFVNLDIRNASTDKILALLPGSRKQEIVRILPTMLEAAKMMDFNKIVVACTDNFDLAFYHQFAQGDHSIQFIFGRTWDLLQSANAALVTSGTATLETALIGCPQVVLYKTSPVSYVIGKRLIKVKYISLVNLILDKPVVIELIQSEANPTKITEATNQLSVDSANLIKDEVHSVLASNGQSGYEWLAKNLL